MATEVRRSLPVVIAEAIETLTAFSVPLYVDVRNRPLLCGTGFFVNVGSECFLVSAAHVLDAAKTHGIYFYSTSKLIRHLDGRMIRSGSPLKRSGDRIDVGVVRLGPAGRPPYPEVRKFAMDISYLTPRRVPRGGRNYVLVGYPETKNRLRPKYGDVLAVPYAYRADSVPESEYASYGVSPESHVVLPLDLRRGYDAANRPVHFPRPQGMSGAPMVVLYEEDGESRVFPVVAVGIEYRRKERVLIATDVQFVLEAMRRAA